jgi:hypothetical protein
MRIFLFNNYFNKKESTFNEDELDLLDSHVEDLSKLKTERVNLVEKFCSELESLMREYELRLDSTSSLNQLIDPTLSNKFPLSQENVNKFRLSLEKVHVVCHLSLLVQNRRRRKRNKRIVIYIYIYTYKR